LGQLQNSKREAKAMFNQQLSPYNYPSHVLFQFILVAFLKTRYTAQKLKVISLQISSQVQSDVVQKKIKHELFLAAEQLAGQSSPFHSHFSWSPSQGILSTLKNNCTLFETAFSQDFPEAIDIKKHAIKSWLYSTEIRDLASQLLREFPPAPAATFTQFQKTEAQITRSLKILGREISKMIFRFKDNENVLLCLLQRKEELDTFYGTAFTHKLFKKMYQNLDAVHTFLVNAYSQREFKELIPEITNSINTLHKL
jgi:hypothetical protein